MIYLCEDDDNVRLLLEHNVSTWGYDVQSFSRGDEIIDALSQDRPDTILLDINLPGKSGTDVLEFSKRMYPNVPVIVVSGQGVISTAIEVMQLGAFDYLTKPIDLDRLEIIIRNAVKQNELYKEIELLSLQTDSIVYPEILANSDSMKKVFRMMSKVHDTDNSVLIYGETGVGKELIARAIHYHGKRKDGPFVVVNCAAIPRELLESEFFGHEKGAFTGAVQRKIGKFEQAHKGTIFLDEVGEMDLSLQAKLLRLIQTKSFERIGGNETILSDARIVSATNKNLVEEIALKNFREDLYFRLSSFPITIPPLRQRRSDILLLSYEFLKRFSTRYNRPISDFSSKTLSLLLKYSYPGNIRELEHVIEHAVIMCESDRIEPQDLPESFLSGTITITETTNSEDEIIVPFEMLKKRALQNALRITNGNLVEAASQLQIGRSTLYRLLEKYEINHSK